MKAKIHDKNRRIGLLAIAKEFLSATQKIDEN
jgi:hypothetical protein